MGRSIRFVSPVYLLAGAISWPFVKVGFRLRARGIENLPDGGVVVRIPLIPDIHMTPVITASFRCEV